MQMIPESTRRKHLKNSRAGLVHRSLVEAAVEEVQQTGTRIHALCFCQCQICAEGETGKWVSRRTFNRHQREREWSVQQFDNLLRSNVYATDEALFAQGNGVAVEEDNQEDQGDLQQSDEGEDNYEQSDDDDEIDAVQDGDNEENTEIQEVFRNLAECGPSRAVSFDEAFQEKVQTGKEGKVANVHQVVSLKLESLSAIEVW
ncbi:hypothetical protein R1sor_026196 [Riccia sorocarpa]|uniref:Transposase n=1 Tax=Riccia sorocarpa TaxID=122646 RepID=A0ABD3GAR0_9MARC